MEIFIVFIDGQMLTLLWKLADSAFSEMLDSDKPTCSRTFILSCIMGLTNTSKPYQTSNNHIQAVTHEKINCRNKLN